MHVHLQKWNHAQEIMNSFHLHWPSLYSTDGHHCWKGLHLTTQELGRALDMRADGAQLNELNET